MLQMFDSLEMLEKTVNDVYEKVANRVKVENDRVARTRQRLAIAKEKLEIIKGNERATTVFSPAKYPAPKTLDDFVPMYNSINPLSRIVHPDYDLDEEVETSTRGARRPQEDFDFLRRLTQPEQGQTNKQGLGRLPEYLPTVSSLLLFNSAENPYKEFKLLDNTQGTDGPEQVIETPQGPKGDGLKTGELAELEREKINKPAWTAEAPELEFPADLPEIDNIAVHDWTHVDLPSIAPSFEQAQALLSLPAPPAPPNPDAAAPAPQPPAPTPAAAPPAPPPAPPPQPPAPQPPQQHVPQAPQPIPEPPVPVPVPVPEQQAPEPEPEPEEEKGPDLPSMPTNFLDEIRGFNKVALRTAEKTEKKNAGNDMMSRILARGKMMKGESTGEKSNGDEKIAMPSMDKAKPKRAPAPAPQPSIQDMVLARRQDLDDGDSDGDWSDSD